MEYIVTVNQEKTKQNCSLSQMQILGREEENKDFVRKEERMDVSKQLTMSTLEPNELTLPEVVRI